MKNKTLFLIGLIAVLLFNCSGSETYRGTWKAMDMDDQKFEISFDAKKFTIKNAEGKTQEYDYSQNSVNISNSQETFGIQLGDGRGYQIFFKNSSDESQGLIRDENGNPAFTISRKDYITYKEMYHIM
jgi:hypothetical protein